MYVAPATSVRPTAVVKHTACTVTCGYARGALYMTKKLLAAAPRYPLIAQLSFFSAFRHKSPPLFIV